MQIHKHLLTFDGDDTGSVTYGDVVDLGFDGDFDKRHGTWDTFFVHVKSNGSDDTTACTVALMTGAARGSGSYGIDTPTELGSISFTSAEAKAGCVKGVRLPEGVKRFVAGYVVQGAEAVVTAGITDSVDFGGDWTNLRKGVEPVSVNGTTAGVGQPGFMEAHVAAS